jgi:hypothetical protein
LTIETQPKTDFPTGSQPADRNSTFQPDLSSPIEIQSFDRTAACRSSSTLPNGHQLEVRDSILQNSTFRPDLNMPTEIRPSDRTDRDSTLRSKYGLPTEIAFSYRTTARRPKCTLPNGHQPVVRNSNLRTDLNLTIEIEPSDRISTRRISTLRPNLSSRTLRELRTELIGRTYS